MVVAGTGTDIGKTWVSVQLLRAWRDAGLAVSARKPAQSFAAGDDPAGHDAALLAVASDEDSDDVCPVHRHYPLAMAPPMAARALGRPPVVIGDLVTELRWPADLDVGLVETAGGLRSPQAEDGDALDMAVAVGADIVVLVADAGLGTVHAVRSCVDALSDAGLPALVVLNRYDDTDALHRANLDWLRDVDGYDVRPWMTTDVPVIAATLSGGGRPA